MFVSTARLNRLFHPLDQSSAAGVDLAVSLHEAGSGKLSWLARLINQLLGRFHGTIVKIAQTAVNLSQVAPRLAKLSSGLEGQARVQRESAEAIAEASRDMSGTVQSIAQGAAEAAAFTSQVQAAAHQADAGSARAEEQIRAIGVGVGMLSGQLDSLRESSESIGETVHLIKGIADRTRILSLNAAIEAARAGEAGRGFAIVADEIRKLADQTTEATRHVEQLLATIAGQVTEAATSMGTVRQQVDDGMAVTSEARTQLHAAAEDIDTLIRHVRTIADASQTQSERVGDVAARIASVADSTARQLDDALRVSDCAVRVRAETEALLTEVGEFRFEGHRKTRERVEEALARWRLERLDRADLEGKLGELCGRQSAFELLYVTDAHGRQVTANVGPAGSDASALGRDWRERPWFREVVKHHRLYVSDIYRSVATDDFCFTVSAPLLDPAGKLLGVLGADVRFDHMLRL